MLGWNDVEAYNAGLRAHFKGQPIESCPHLVSSRWYDLWRDGWLSGQALTQLKEPPRASLQH